jgi:hypothetical protein
VPRVIFNVDDDNPKLGTVNAWLGFTNDISKSGSPLAAAGYGRYNLENYVGPGGTSMSALDAVRLAATLADPDGGGIFTKEMRETFLTDCTTGGRYAFDSTTKQGDGSFSGYKGGSLPTSGNTLYFETGGVSFSFNIAAQTSMGPGFYPANATLLNAIRSRDWKNVNLWEANGYKPVTSNILLKFPLPKLPIPVSPKDLHLNEPFSTQQILLPGKRRNP